ncbi:hypothetical protein Bbelb_330680 [Branchiostoma belcheri]|nr:hypothetical protein Bbelb_330680 [Branchiostoma belcheri]
MSGRRRFTGNGAIRQIRCAGGSGGHSACPGGFVARRSGGERTQRVRQPPAPGLLLRIAPIEDRAKEVSIVRGKKFLPLRKAATRVSTNVLEGRPLDSSSPLLLTDSRCSCDKHAAFDSDNTLIYDHQGSRCVFPTMPVSATDGFVNTAAVT